MTYFSRPAAMGLTAGFLTFAMGAASGVANAGCGVDALGTSRILQVGARGGLEIGLQSYPRTLYLQPKEVILTFDDGPAPATTPKVLNALKAECVKATFFLIGRNAMANPRLVRRMVREGHTVAHHTMTHPVRSLRALPVAAAIRDIERGVAAVETAAYGTNYAGGRPVTPFFRFPGFADSKPLNAWLGKRDITVFGTDVWASDWRPMVPGAMLGLVMRRLARRGGGIVLFHDTHASTAAMLPAFLRALKKGGYRIVPVTPGAAAPLLVHAGPRWSSQTEAIIGGLRVRTRGKARKKRMVRR